jgi:phosphopantothenoylcysteine decarboxylase / phosphopantothenate---cysteine ligase
MDGLSGKKILLGVSGSIAAYKAAFLTRLLIKAGAEVQIIMTPAATDFITPLTLATLSKKPVFTSVLAQDSWNNHVEMGLWADVMLVAPATATTLAKMAHGICDNIIVATYLSAKCPVFFAPAMDLDMWKHPATVANVQRLQSFGNRLIPVGHGELASGLSGDGRMAEPEDIVTLLLQHFAKAQSLHGKKALVTAGPTYEALDPVRFIGNYSSGKMGIAIAVVLAERGADVTLVLGPSKESTSHAGVHTVHVQSAEEMYAACAKLFPVTDISILAAAVADYRPKNISEKKIKKTGNDLSVELVRTTDIAAALGKIKKEGQLLIGFALETNDELENAKGKLERKNFDFIVLNSLRDKGAGFQHNTNKITIVGKNNKITEFGLKTKVEVANDIIDEVETLLIKKNVSS